MGDNESELWADLEEIDVRRRQLRDTLEKLRSTPSTLNVSKPSFVSDSGVDFGHKTYEDSIEELMGKVDINPTTSRAMK